MAWLLVPAVLLLIVPAASAQVGKYGTWVRFGDADYFSPIIKKDPAAIAVFESDFGVPGDAQDNCILLDTAAYDGGTAGAPTNKDIRLNSCVGKPAGTFIGDGDTVEHAAAYTAVPTTVQYGDVNGNAKYDKAEPVYLTTSAVAGLTPTAGTGMWTLRLTPAGDRDAGTFALTADTDFSTWSKQAKIQAFSFAEREDKLWYLIPAPVGDASVKKGFPVPEKSIRLAGAPVAPAAISVAQIEIPNPDVQAGAPFQVLATVENKGAMFGVGIVTSKLDGVMVDAKISPVLSPGEKASMLLTLVAPKHAGPAALEVNDLFQIVNIGGANASASPESTEIAGLKAVVAALQTKVDALETKAAALEAKQNAPAAQALAVEDVQTHGAPGPSLVFLLAGLVFAIMTLRGRGKPRGR